MLLITNDITFVLLLIVLTTFKGKITWLFLGNKGLDFKFVKKDVIAFRLSTLVVFELLESR